MNFRIKNPIIKTAFLVIFFFLLYLISRYFRIAPTVISLLLPFGNFFLSQRHTLVFSLSIFFLIFISGFIVEAIGIFLLFFIPIIIFININKKILKHSLISSFSAIDFYIMYIFFGELLPDIATQKLILSIIIIAYILFSNFYGYLLEKLKNEIETLLRKFL